MTPEQQWGLLAIGRSDRTEIQIDETCAGERLLAMEVSTPNWSCRFRISEQRIVTSMALFLQLHEKDSIVIGDFDGAPVDIRRDREFPDRFFIVVGEGCARTEFVIAGQQEVSDLTNALLQASEALK